MLERDPVQHLHGHLYPGQTHKAGTKNASIDSFTNVYVLYMSFIEQTGSVVDLAALLFTSIRPRQDSIIIGLPFSSNVRDLFAFCVSMLFLGLKHASDVDVCEMTRDTFDFATDRLQIIGIYTSLDVQACDCEEMCTNLDTLLLDTTKQNLRDFVMEVHNQTLQEKYAIKFDVRHPVSECRSCK